MNIAIVEDTQVGIEILRNLLFEYASKNAVSMDVDTFTSAEDFLKDYRAYQYTIIFMDIFMDGIDGVQASEKVREVDSGSLIVFLTASASHMPQAFNVHAYDYIQKPVDPEHLFRVLDEIRSLQGKRSNIPQLSFIAGRKEYSLNIPDVVSITVNGNYLDITDRNGQIYHPRMTFTAVCDQLAKEPRFLMLLRGVLVNMDYVTEFSDNFCRLEDGTTLPVNIKNSRKIEQIWSNYCLSQKRAGNIPN